MDRDAGESDRRDDALQDDTGMIGSESEEPGVYDQEADQARRPSKGG